MKTIDLKDLHKRKYRLAKRRNEKFEKEKTKLICSKIQNFDRKHKNNISKPTTTCNSTDKEYILPYFLISFYSKLFEISFAQSARAAQYTVCFSTEGWDSPLWIYDGTIWWWDFSNAGALGNAVYFSIARFIMAWTGST